MLEVYPFLLVLSAYSVLAAFLMLVGGLWVRAQSPAYKHHNSPWLHPTQDIENLILHHATIAALFLVLPKIGPALTRPFTDSQKNQGPTTR